MSDADSIVLGIRSYEDLLRDPHVQHLVRTLVTTKSLLFIGFGSGLRDPNFSALLQWMRTVLSADSDLRHYRLVKQSELQRAKYQHEDDKRFDVLAFGADHKDLTAFLQRLGRRSGDPSTPQAIPTITSAAGAPRPVPDSTRGPDLAVEDVRGEAGALKGLGDIALRRSNPNGAAECYQQARQLYKQVGDLRGEAAALKGLEDVALQRSHADAAAEHYQDAQFAFEQAGDLRGKAYCIKSLGDATLLYRSAGEAEIRYEDALTLYERTQDLRGRANSVKALGDAALQQFDHERARLRYEQALDLYIQANDLRGRAACLKSLGDTALQAGELDKAKVRHEEARSMFRRIGDLRDGPTPPGD